jgi:hypothetical protein
MTAPIESPPELSHDVPLSLRVAAGLCAAAGILSVVAWTLPNLVNLAYGHSLRGPSLFMVLALITLATNWHELH